MRRKRDVFKGNERRGGGSGPRVRGVTVPSHDQKKNLCGGGLELLKR